MICDCTITNLCLMPVCSAGTVIPTISADITGTWLFTTTFNGAYVSVSFEATNGEAFILPIQLNEDYTYVFRLYKPDGTQFNNATYSVKTIPMLLNQVYSCPCDSTVKRIDFIAEADQTTYTASDLLGKTTIAVSVEGANKTQGSEVDEFLFSNGIITFNSPLIEGQKVIILIYG